MKIWMGQLLLLFAAGPALAMQAATEYGVMAAKGAIQTQDTRLGVCRLDSRVLSCISQSYPKTVVVVAVIVFLLLLRLVSRGGGAHYRR